MILIIRLYLANIMFDNLEPKHINLEQESLRILEDSEIINNEMKQKFNEINEKFKHYYVNIKSSKYLTTNLTANNIEDHKKNTIGITSMYNKLSSTILYDNVITLLSLYFEFQKIDINNFDYRRNLERINKYTNKYINLDYKFEIDISKFKQYMKIYNKRIESINLCHCYIYSIIDTMNLYRTYNRSNLIKTYSRYDLNILVNFNNCKSPKQETLENAEEILDHKKSEVTKQDYLKMILGLNILYIVSLLNCKTLNISLQSISNSIRCYIPEIMFFKVAKTFIEDDHSNCIDMKLMKRKHSKQYSLSSILKNIKNDNKVYLGHKSYKIFNDQ